MFPAIYEENIFTQISLLNVKNLRLIDIDTKNIISIRCK